MYKFEKKLIMQEGKVIYISERSIVSEKTSLVPHVLASFFPLLSLFLSISPYFIATAQRRDDAY
jgi:hypothetical protein